MRADRQPEFTQVDIEMSFVEQDDVMAQLEDVLSDAFARVGVEMPTPLRRLSYWDAMDTYGSDKPDTRYGMELVDLTDIFTESAFKVFASAATTEGHVVKAINAKGAGVWPRAQIDKLAKVAATFGAKGLAWIAFREDGSVNSPIVKIFTDEEMEELRRRCDVEPGDLVMFAAGPRLVANGILGGMRSHMADALNVPREGHEFLWVVNFPLFHWDEEGQRYEAEPFREDGSVNSPIVKFFTDEEMEELRRRCDVEPGDLVMFAAGPRLEANGILGGMRSHMADALNVPREGHEFLWVVNFPLFHWDEEGQRYEAEHQPFTLPHVDELHLLDEDPLKMGSCTYDFVMDGFEAGGGGMRIHDAELQLKMLEFMGFSEPAL